jgi:hypothetical protein
MKKNDDYSNGDKFSQELRAQPRRSNFHQDKLHSRDPDDTHEDHAPNRHRTQLSKNFIRVQLRRIQQLFKSG